MGRLGFCVGVILVLIVFFTLIIAGLRDDRRNQEINETLDNLDSCLAELDYYRGVTENQSSRIVELEKLGVGIRERVDVMTNAYVRCMDELGFPVID